MKKHVCKNCKLIVEESTKVCPLCKKNAFTKVFQGQINVIDANKSAISKKLGITSKGEFAIKVN